MHTLSYILIIGGLWTISIVVAIKLARDFRTITRRNRQTTAEWNRGIKTLECQKTAPVPTVLLLRSHRGRDEAEQQFFSSYERARLEEAGYFQAGWNTCLIDNVTGAVIRSRTHA